VAAGGQYVRGGPTYQYQTGPDGKQYAVGGEVSIDTSAVSGDPEASIAKAQTVRRAALAPADPSGADRSVAGAASQMETQARQELMKEKAAKTGGGGPGTGEEASVRPSKPNTVSGYNSPAANITGKILDLVA
jgi:hypothetical protein